MANLVIDKVTQLIEPILDELDFELVDIEYLSENGRWALRIYVDKEGGITLDDCAKLSRELGDLLEVEDILRGEYVLEVSSPGLNRTLKREKDLLAAVGKKIKVKMAAPVNRRQSFTGYLRSFQDGTLYLDAENNLVSLSWRDVEKAKLVYELES